ncbi:MAG: DMT family transporter [Roseibium sp.]|uniref:DMT family transporter n=1 Tax=Roseibium sp. TaxID=1936156 RepID=UPI003D9C40B3
MTTTIATDRKANLAGSLWMILSMAAFAVEDVFVKAAASVLPIGQILFLFGVGGMIVFAAVALWNREPLFVRDVVSRPMLVRAGFEITGRLFYVLAVALIPLSAATVILQATPIVVVAGAVLVFNEKVGWRRWLAILIGLAGVIVVVRPGTDGFSPLSLLAVVGMIGFAGRDLASRIAPATIGTVLLGFYGFLSVVIAGVVYTLVQGEAFVSLEPVLSALLLGAVLSGVAAYAFLMKAMRTGEVSAVTPFRYSRLLFGIALGVFVFGEQLSFEMLVGSGLIVVSGLFILWRGQQQRA